MVDAFFRACRDMLSPRQFGSLLLSLAISALAFAALWAGASWLLGAAHPFGTAWLDAPVTLLGSLAILWLAWLLFPAAAIVVQGFFLEGVVAALERRHYPWLKPARGLRLGEVLLSTLSLSLLMVVGNLLLLPVYLFWPMVNLLLFYGFNGWLLGRQYFELVALRRLAANERRRLWRRERARFLLAGLAIAVLFSLPVVGLAAPIFAAAFMLHVFIAATTRQAVVMVGA
jgi:CysZ protein